MSFKFPANVNRIDGAAMHNVVNVYGEDILGQLSIFNTVEYHYRIFFQSSEKEHHILPWNGSIIYVEMSKRLEEDPLIRR